MKFFQQLLDSTFSLNTLKSIRIYIQFLICQSAPQLSESQKSISHKGLEYQNCHSTHVGKPGLRAKSGTDIVWARTYQNT